VLLCGDGVRPFLNAAGVEHFRLTTPPALTLALDEVALPPCAQPAPERALEPETPPPRPA
jgi:hypothetical protein